MLLARPTSCILCLFLVGHIVLAQQPASGARRVIKENVVWTDLPGRLEGKRVTIGLADGSAVSGEVLQVTDQQISLSQSIRSRKSVSRAEAKVVQYDLIQGKARAGWMIGLMTAGVAVATLLGAAERLGGENAEHFLPVAIAMGGGGAAGGYAIGRARDRTAVLLSIRPGP